MNNSPEQKTATPTQTDSSGEVYLKIQIERDTPAALPMQYAREVLVIPTRRLTPIPNMPPCVLGLLNQRSRVFWVVDLAQILQLSPSKKYSQQYQIAIVRADNIPLGLVVARVKGTIRLDRSSIRSPINTVPPHLAPYVAGCVATQSEVILILDPRAIINSPILHDNY